LGMVFESSCQDATVSEPKFITRSRSVAEKPRELAA
jgi:hypothetical protein